MRRAFVAIVVVVLAACGSGDGGTADVPAPADGLAPDLPADVPSSLGLSLAINDDFGTPVTGRSDVDLRVPFAGTRDLAVRCTRAGATAPGIGVTYSLAEGSGRLVLSATGATSGDGGLASVTASWAPDATCPGRDEDVVTACLADDPGTCVRFHLWTGRADAAILSVEVDAPATGPAVDTAKVYVFRPGEDGKPTCADLNPLALPTAAATSQPFAPGTLARFPTLPGATTTPYQVWTVLALAGKGTGSPLLRACRETVRTSNCDQVDLKMLLGLLP